MIAPGNEGDSVSGGSLVSAALRAAERASSFSISSESLQVNLCVLKDSPYAVTETGRLTVKALW